jgi:hypothetical protein
MSDIKNILNDYFNTYRTTSEYKDRGKMEIMCKRASFEQNLDTMWDIYRKGNPQQIVEYSKGVAQIKECGLKVLRNSAGKHKIVLPQAR